MHQQQANIQKIARKERIEYIAVTIQVMHQAYGFGPRSGYVDGKPLWNATIFTFHQYAWLTFWHKFAEINSYPVRIGEFDAVFPILPALWTMHMFVCVFVIFCYDAVFGLHPACLLFDATTQTQ